MSSKSPFLSSLRYEIKQFCKNTGIHGYVYIVLPNRILLERVVWIFVVLASLGVALGLLYAAWKTFADNPTLLVTESTHYPIWNFPFPAVTICDYNKISKKQALKLAHKMAKRQDVSEAELASEFGLLLHPLQSDAAAADGGNYTRLQDLLEHNGLTVGEALRRISPGCSDTLRRCLWKGEEKKCESIFETVLTAEGFCCTFNYFAPRNHTFGGTMPSKAPLRPRRVSATGMKTALEVLLAIKPTDYFASQVPSFGFKVMIHTSYDYPDGSAQGMLNDANIINLLSIDEEMTYATPDVRSLEFKVRSCLFRDENQLKYFHYYSYNNCMVECKINISRRLCGCIPFQFYNDYVTVSKRRPRLCNLRDFSCLLENKNLLWSSESYVAREDTLRELGLYETDCQCLPECEYVRYIAEASVGALQRTYTNNQKTLYGGINVANHSVIRVYHNDLVATRNRRDVLFNWHTLLAFYGGLLGLFTGSSFVSVIEIIYFFTIRLFLDSTRKGNDAPKAKKKRAANKLSVDALERSRDHFHSDHVIYFK